jgi:hypothetical protein
MARPKGDYNFDIIRKSPITGNHIVERTLIMLLLAGVLYGMVFLGLDFDAAHPGLLRAV